MERTKNVKDGKPNVLIIIPAYNESENIEKGMKRLISQAPQYDSLIVNDGSTDAT